MSESKGFNPPNGWVHIEKARYPVEDIDRNDFWVHTIGPHTRCDAKCLDRLRDIVRRGRERGVFVDPFGPPVVPMRPVPTKDSEYREQILVGVCQSCGTVFWTEYKPPSDEEVARLREEYQREEEA